MPLVQASSMPADRAKWCRSPVSRQRDRASMPAMMRLIWPVRLGCAAGLVCVLGGAAGTQSLFDTGPVDFTQVQATRGQAAYTESCAACHGPNLDDGQFAPPVKGVAKQD